MFPAANLLNGLAIPALRAPRCRRQQRTRWAWRPLWLMTVVHRQMRSPISSVCLSVQQLGGSLSCHRRSGSDRCTDDAAELALCAVPFIMAAATRACATRPANVDHTLVSACG